MLSHTSRKCEGLQNVKTHVTNVTSIRNALINGYTKELTSQNSVVVHRTKVRATKSRRKEIVLGIPLRCETERQ